MEFCALASGSSGNCFYVEKEGKAILIDCGISSKQITERLCLLGKSPEKIQGIFISHEHTDHIRGIRVFSSKFAIPLYATKKTSKFIEADEELINIIKNNEQVNVGRLRVEAFQKSHDAADPVSFAVEAKEKKVCIATDIGHACRNVVKNVSCSDAVIIESNHDTAMLKNGPYPEFLKDRILSKKGHLSNYDAALLMLEHAGPKLKHVVLSHLSENNNTEKLALMTMKEMLKHRKDISPKIHISGRGEPTELISV